MTIDYCGITGDETNGRVLIIEDDPEIAELIELAFRIYLPKVEVATTNLGNEGVETALQKSFDLCITDLNLPDIHGLDVIVKLHDNNDMPIIVISANEDTETIEKVIDKGICGYFEKPFSPVELLNKANKLIKRRSPVPSK